MERVTCFKLPNNNDIDISQLIDFEGKRKMFLTFKGWANLCI